MVLSIAKYLGIPTLSSLTFQSFARNILFGFVLIHLWLFICIHGLLEVFLDKFRIPNPFAQWAATAWTLQLAIFHRCIEKDWSRMYQLCIQLHNHLMMPYFNEVVVRTLAVAPVVFALSWPLAHYYKWNMSAQDVDVNVSLLMVKRKYVRMI